MARSPPGRCSRGCEDASALGPAADSNTSAGLERGGLERGGRKGQDGGARGRGTGIETLKERHSTPPRDSLAAGAQVSEARTSYCRVGALAVATSGA